ncbi:cation:proton antiporter [Afifella sp. IM 167]|uniref:cation:proton antiporter n=1 Tax=Afifella sp. IM 167 TaxID=2033586 RepID=UPI001CCE01FA|nr:cation:proton antiporter [Afifella sp. IM 167]MBZ8133106.1 sodium:proton antiporter [Afifella sp. IM 167]
MSSAEFLEICVVAALVCLIVSFALIAIRIIRGPTFADRVLALDMLVSVGIGFIAVIGVKTQFYLYIDIAIALGLVGFLATVAFARFVMHRGEVSDDETPQNPREHEA